MNSVLTPLLFAASATLASAAGAPTFPAVTLPDTEVRALPTSRHGRHYVLQIGLPASYRSASHRRYPVLYVTDGYWDFPTLLTSYLNLVYDKMAPEVIIVGIGYPGEHSVDEYNRMRQWELSPVRLGGIFDTNSGHAGEFLDTIDNEIIPFVEREYRVDSSNRILAGSSLGGLFALYALFTHPSLFHAYIAAVPAVSEKDDWFFDYEAKFAEHPLPLQARLYMTAAEFDKLRPGIERFEKVLRQRNYPGLKYQYRLIDGEGHAGEKAESYTRGMIYVFGNRK